MNRIKFCVKLEHSSSETTRMIQKAAAVGNWWWAASWWHCTHSCITSQAEFFDITSNHPGNSAPLKPIFSALRLLAFPKTKITFERQRISDRRWNSGKHSWAADGDWVNYVKSQGTYFEGDWYIIVLYKMFLVSSINISIFNITGLNTFRTDLVYMYVCERKDKVLSRKTQYIYYRKV